MDLKQGVHLCKKKIEKSLQENTGLKVLNELFPNTTSLRDVDYWYEKFKYNVKRNNLENFYLYRAAGQFGLYIGIDDADITERALNYLKEKILSIDEVVDVKIGKEISNESKIRGFQVTLSSGEIIYLESDTANSLQTQLGYFIRASIPKLVNLKKGDFWPNETYVKFFHLDAEDEKYNYDAFKFYYFYTLIEKLKQYLIDEEDLQKLAYFEDRAGKTHIVENMIVVPFGYNSKRGFSLKTYSSGLQIRDDLKLTLQDFKEMCDDPTFTDEKLQNRLSNDKCTLESIQFLLRHEKILFGESLALYEIFKQEKVIN